MKQAFALFTALLILSVSTFANENNNITLGDCEWGGYFAKPNCGNKYPKGTNMYVKWNAEDHEDIDYVKLYLNGHEVRKESSAPYEWGKSGSSDDELKNMQPGNYKLKVKIKDECGDYHYKECHFEIEGHDECNWNGYFDKPDCGKKYPKGTNMYVRWKADKHQDIEYVKLYLNGHEIRKESSAPYEWGKSGSSDDELKNMQPGNYKLKVKIKDKCGDYHYKECHFEIEGDDDCNWNGYFDKPDCGKKYPKGTNMYVRWKADKHQDIEYVKLYLNGHEIRKESSAPYEWGKSGSSDDELKNMQPGNYKLKVKIKDKCGDYHYKECHFEIEGHDECNWNGYFDKPDCGKKYPKGTNMYVRWKADKHQDIEYVKLYLNGHEIRKESSAPYEWGKSGSSDDELKNMQPGNYKLKVKIKDKCGDYHYKECHFEIEGHDECNWNGYFDKPDCGKKYPKGTNMYVRWKADKHQDIEYVKLYLNGHEIRKESSAPYEWGKSGSSDDELKNMQPGNYKLKVKIKDNCGDYHYKECHFEIEGADCNWNAWFEYPDCGDTYDEGKNIYVKVKAEKHQDIEWMKLYIDGKEIRKESSAPYEWGKSGSSDDELKDMEEGEYRLKVKIKDKCGDYHYKECKFYVED